MNFLSSRPHDIETAIMVIDTNVQVSMRLVKLALQVLGRGSGEKFDFLIKGSIYSRASIGVCVVLKRSSADCNGKYIILPM